MNPVQKLRLFRGVWIIINLENRLSYLAKRKLITSIKNYVKSNFKSQNNN